MANGSASRVTSTEGFFTLAPDVDDAALWAGAPDWAVELGAQAAR